jgi:hypothetical protein
MGASGDDGRSTYSVAKPPSGLYGTGWVAGAKTAGSNTTSPGRALCALISSVTPDGQDAPGGGVKVTATA